MGGKGDPFISLSKVMKNLTGMYNFDEIHWSKLSKEGVGAKKQ